MTKAAAPSAPSRQVRITSRWDDTRVLFDHLVDGLMMRSWTEVEYNALLHDWSPKATADQLKYKWTDPDGVRIF